MVNDKMVNGFMEKKKYIVPFAEITILSTKELMGFTEEISGGGTAANPAPARRTKVF